MTLLKNVDNALPLNKAHKLIYTNFTYSNLKITPPVELSTYPTGKLSVGGYEDLRGIVAGASVIEQNPGSVRGADVPWLYIEYPKSAKHLVRQLRGFNNVGIKAGQHENVKFELRHRDISYWYVKAQKCAVAPGTYTVHIGTSSSDLRPHGTFTVQTKG